MADYYKTVDGIDTRGNIAPGDIPIEVRDKNYIHNQYSSSAEWIIEHRLGKVPTVTCYQGNNIVYGAIEIDYDNEENTINRLKVIFNFPIKGKAICN